MNGQLLEQAVTELVTELRTSSDDWASASLVVGRLPDDLVEALATASLLADARSRIRAATRVAEHEAVRPKRGTQKFEKWVNGTPERLAAEEEWQQSCLETDRRHVSRMVKLMDDYRAELRIEWTDELLSSSFALPDGTRVTWAEATADQHLLRAEMFEQNAISNSEGAARHRKAIDDMAAAGARCLGDLRVRA